MSLKFFWIFSARSSSSVMQFMYAKTHLYGSQQALCHPNRGVAAVTEEKMNRLPSFVILCVDCSIVSIFVQRQLDQFMSRTQVWVGQYGWGDNNLRLLQRLISFLSRLPTTNKPLGHCHSHKRYGWEDSLANSFERLISYPSRLPTTIQQVGHHYFSFRSIFHRQRMNRIHQRNGIIAFCYF